MTDKQIIIDGVDVSGCYELFNGCCCDNGSFYCSGQPNCQFKLEKRGYKLEQITEFTPREELIETITHLRVLNAELESYNEQLKESQDIEIKQNKNLREQLKRKEQECERLKHDNGYEVGALERTIDNLKAENDKYSLFIEKLCDYAGLECDNEEQAIRTLSDLASQMNKARWIIDRYKQTLTEIKEIAEKMKKMSEEDGGELTECFFMDKQCEKCSEDKCLPYWFEQILQKISECEGNNEYS